MMCHVHGSPQIRQLSRVKPGAAHEARAHQDLEGAELAEDRHEGVQRQRRPVDQSLPDRVSSTSVVPIFFSMPRLKQQQAKGLATISNYTLYRVELLKGDRITTVSM
jgi:hypothetical protein